ncbi:MAG: hypothetical protein QW228_00870 [Candidatus Aenigmatarchaeota archaeon]
MFYITKMQLYPLDDIDFRCGKLYCDHCEREIVKVRFDAYVKFDVVGNYKRGVADIRMNDISDGDYLLNCYCKHEVSDEEAEFIAIILSFLACEGKKGC